MMLLSKKLLGEVPMVYRGGGGGKSGGGQTMAPPPLPVNTVGNTIDDVVTKTAEEEDAKVDAVDKKKLGTRGLQIPLAAESSTTIPTTTAAGAGVQV